MAIMTATLATETEVVKAALAAKATTAAVIVPTHLYAITAQEPTGFGNAPRSADVVLPLVVNYPHCVRYISSIEDLHKR